MTAQATAHVLSLGLVRYDRMVTAIAECHEIDEVKDIRDKARAIEIYAAQAQNLEAEMRASEVRHRAERRCAQLAREKREAGELAKQGERHRSTETTSKKTLKDLGISKRQSADWDKLADIPDEEFDARFKSGELVTTKELVRLSPRSKGHKTKDDSRKYAMAVWSRLRDLPSLFPNSKFKSVVNAMDSRMREDIADSLKPVRKFLDRLERELENVEA